MSVTCVEYVSLARVQHDRMERDGGRTHSVDTTVLLGRELAITRKVMRALPNGNRERTYRGRRGFRDAGCKRGGSPLLVDGVNTWPEK